MEDMYEEVLRQLAVGRKLFLLVDFLNEFEVDRPKVKTSIDGGSD